MFRPCANLVRNVSLSTIDRLVKRTLLSSRELSYELPRTSSFASLNDSRSFLHRRTGVNFSTAAPSESENSSTAKANMEAEGGAASPTQPPTDKQVAELLAAVETYKEKLATTEDKYRRQLAETENVRQRFMRQVDEAKTFGIQNFCKDLLEIADVLELATESVPKDAIAKGDNGTLKSCTME